MTAKTAVDQMVVTREAMATVLDSKIGHLSEWKAFRAADRAVMLALAALSEAPVAPIQPPPPAPVTPRRRFRINGEVLPYMTLADNALAEAGKPLPTSS